MVNVFLLRRWIWAVILVELSCTTLAVQAVAAAAVAAETSTDYQKPQRLRKKKHFKQAHDNHIAVDHVNQANQLAQQQAAGQFHTPEPSAAYVKCRSILEGVAGSDSLVDEPEYLQFLKSLTGGKVTANSFEELTGRWMSIFYRTACGPGGQGGPSGQGRRGGNCDRDGAVIMLDNTMENYEQILAFCDAVMDQATTTASLTFGYSIKYDSQSISEDALPDCLATATTNLLLENFGCETDLRVQRERRETGLRGGHNTARKASAIRFESEEERMFAELLLREKEDKRFLDTNMSMENDCEYDINTEVPNIFSIGCIPPEPAESTTECGLVRSTVTVSTSQQNFPFEAELKRNITEALRLAIDGDAFEGYFPENCILQTRL